MTLGACCAGWPQSSCRCGQGQQPCMVHPLGGSDMPCMQKTELKFDLVGPVDELAKQITLEFDFEQARAPRPCCGKAGCRALREGGDAGGPGNGCDWPEPSGEPPQKGDCNSSWPAGRLRAPAAGQSMAGEVAVPVSVPGLVSREVLVMSFLEGLPITRAQVRLAASGSRPSRIPPGPGRPSLAARTQLLHCAAVHGHGNPAPGSAPAATMMLPPPPAQALVAARTEEQQAFGKRLVFSRIMEAYGRMLLQAGLFQADVHPGERLCSPQGHLTRPATPLPAAGCKRPCRTRPSPCPTLDCRAWASPALRAAGNILLRADGTVALLDFGQAKQLTRQVRLDLARLMVALSAAEDAALMDVRTRLTTAQQVRGPAGALRRVCGRTFRCPARARLLCACACTHLQRHDRLRLAQSGRQGCRRACLLRSQVLQMAVSDALGQLGIETAEGPVGLRVQLAYGMFDTRGRCALCEPAPATPHPQCCMHVCCVESELPHTNRQQQSLPAGCPLSTRPARSRPWLSSASHLTSSSSCASFSCCGGPMPARALAVHRRPRDSAAGVCSLHCCRTLHCCQPRMLVGVACSRPACSAGLADACCPPPQGPGQCHGHRGHQRGLRVAAAGSAGVHARLLAVRCPGPCGPCDAASWPPSRALQPVGQPEPGMCRLCWRPTRQHCPRGSGSPGPGLEASCRLTSRHPASCGGARCAGRPTRSCGQLQRSRAACDVHSCGLSARHARHHGAIAHQQRTQACRPDSAGSRCARLAAGPWLARGRLAPGLRLRSLRPGVGLPARAAVQPGGPQRPHPSVPLSICAACESWCCPRPAARLSQLRVQVPLLVLTAAQGGLQPLWAHRLFTQRSLLWGMGYGCICTALSWRLSSTLLKVQAAARLGRACTHLLSGVCEGHVGDCSCLRLGRPAQVILQRDARLTPSTLAAQVSRVAGLAMLPSLLLTGSALVWTALLSGSNPRRQQPAGAGEGQPTSSGSAPAAQQPRLRRPAPAVAVWQAGSAVRQRSSRPAAHGRRAAVLPARRLQACRPLPCRHLARQALPL